MDTVMLGRLGDIQLSASAQANQPQFIFQLFIFGLAGGGTVLASQYWGKGDAETVRKVIGIVVKIAIIFSLILTIIVKLFPYQIIGLYLKNETEKEALIISEAVSYLNIVSWGYLFLGTSMAIQHIIRSAEIVKISVIASFSAFVVNAFFNWVFIFGNLGAPAMGIKGAALGTLIARIVDFLIITIYIFLIDKKLKFRLKYIFLGKSGLMQDFAKYSLPVIANEVMWSLGISVQAAVLGKLNPDVIAASSIANVLQQLATIVIFGIAGASSVVVGKQLGANDRDGAKKSAYTIMIWAIILGITGMVITLCLRKWFVSIYNVSDEVQLLAEKLITIIAILILFISVSAISIVGVLRGAGDTKFTLKLELVSLWLAAVPLGVFLGFVVKAPILVVCTALKIDEPIKSVFAFLRTTKDKTFKNITH